MTTINEASPGTAAVSGTDLTPAATVRPVALSLRANFSWTFVGNVVYAGCQWAMLVVLAKLGTPEMVGQFALGLALSAPVIMFANLQLRGVQATDATRQYAFADYLGLRLITTALAYLVIALIAVAGGYRPATVLVILAIGLAKAFESISDVFYGLLQQHERMDRIARSMVIKGPLSLVLLGAGVALTGSVFGGAVGLVIAWALVLAVYDIPSGAMILRHAPRPRWARDTLARLTWLALPLGVVSLMLSLSDSIPKYFVERYHGEAALGIFAAITYILVAENTVIRALGQSGAPRMAKLCSENCIRDFMKLLGKVIIIGVIIGGTGIFITLLAGTTILRWAYDSSYTEYSYDLFLVAVASTIFHVASFLSISLTAIRYLRIQPVLLGLSTVVMFIACLELVPRHGIKGAAFSLIVTASVQVFTQSLALLHAIRRISRNWDSSLQI